MDIIKVLWMNNGEDGLQQYVELAKDYGIEITTCRCMRDCRHSLMDKNSNWNAVILNADVKTTSPIEKPKVDGLGDAIGYLRDNKPEMPRFVVTSKEKLSSVDNRIVKAIIRKDEELYFLKTSSNQFFEALRFKVLNNPENVVKSKYARVCNFCSEKILVDLLVKFEFEDIQSDTEIPNQCRKMLEWIKNNTFFDGVYLSDEMIRELVGHYKKYNKRFPYTETYDELSLNDFSYAMDKSSKVPEFVKRSLHTCTSTLNPGSHFTEIHKMIEREYVPYLNKSLICELLNILYWCSLQDKNSFEL